jgi:E3 ubiquitin-protein ligase CCNP1IP1
MTILNPTEDYKTSVLSGLDPNTIMECAGRALLFWSYQTNQEMYCSFPAHQLSCADYVQPLPRVLRKDPN